MRRWLTLLLLVVLPLQLSWAAAASSCAHEESGRAAQHVGHHEHEHDEASSAASGDAATDEGGVLTVDADCAYCHLGCAKTVATTFVPLRVAASPDVAVQRDALHTSHIPPGPERPDRRLA